MTDSPIPMRIPCPGTVPDGHGGEKVCGALHIDEGIWITKLHHTHSCQACGMTWRPAVVHTVGVRFLPGFKNPTGSDMARAIEAELEKGAERRKAVKGREVSIESGQRWQHLNIDTEILTVKEVGQYVTGQTKVTFTDGTILPEQTLRSGYRLYSKKQILCVVAGESIPVAYDPQSTLEIVMIEALFMRKSGLGATVHGAAVHDEIKTWEIRNAQGDLLPLGMPVGHIPSLCISQPTLYINPPVGHGG